MASRKHVLGYDTSVDISGSSSGNGEYSILLECNAVQIAKVLSRFQRSLLPPSSKLKIE
jgi:hypothetical protein